MVNERDHILRIPSYAQLHTVKPIIYERADFSRHCSLYTTFCLSDTFPQMFYHIKCFVQCFLLKSITQYNGHHVEFLVCFEVAYSIAVVLRINSSSVLYYQILFVITDKCTFCKIMTPMEYAHEEMANRPLYKQVLSHVVFNFETFRSIPVVYW